MNQPKTPLFAAFPEFDPANAYVLLWSQRQGMLHIETLQEMFANHIAAYQSDCNLEYIPLLIGDERVIEAAASDMQATLMERYNAKRQAAPGCIPYEELP